MNLTDYRTTSMADVFRAVDAAARHAGAAIVDSEVIGLVPRIALDGLNEVAPAFAARHCEAVLEERLASRGLPALGPADVRP